MNRGGRPFRIRKPFFPVMVVIALVMAAIVQWLWNAILPELLNVGTLTYWKALGLLVLCRILFGGFRGGPPRGKPPFMANGFREKWMNMTDEERKNFREQWRQRCTRKD